SPQTLSIGPSRGSATITEYPRRRASMAVARPTGPPPAISTSASYMGSPVARTRPAGRGSPGQCAVFGWDTKGKEQDGVRYCEAGGGQPGCVDQWQCQALGHHGEVVRMGQPPVGAAGDERQPGNHDDARVP